MNGLSVESKKKSLEEIIGISTVSIQYPLQEYLQKVNIFKFDKYLDNKGSVKAKIGLSLEQKSPRS